MSDEIKAMLEAIKQYGLDGRAYEYIPHTGAVWVYFTDDELTRFPSSPDVVIHPPAQLEFNF